MITSFIQQIPTPTLQDVAYKYQYELLENGKDSVVIDSKDLLSDPKTYLKKFCNKINIPFSEQMLKWSKGPIKEDGVWAKYWYTSVHNSTEFQPYKRKEAQVPEDLKELLEECNYYYNELVKYKL